ncbi:CRISPR-associated endonuclease Cas3'' [Nonomuraea maritima]|uniref:CRISPR-associated endonuclease Cas3'' n=1 Tax=Nonomuraea maritima TaxID=683260 RepID=UPI0037117810
MFQLSSYERIRSDCIAGGHKATRLGVEQGHGPLSSAIYFSKGMISLGLCTEMSLMLLGRLPTVDFLDGLSNEACTAWAKHDRDTDGWLPLWRHLADSGQVAGLLWDRWLPLQIKRVIARDLPSDLEDGRRLAVWLATTHDIGKASPAFACQVDPLADAMRAVGLEMPPYKEFSDRKLGPHGLAGQVLIQEWLIERHGWSRSETLQVGVVAGGHHGVPPTASDIKALNDHPELVRTPSCASLWRKVQWELLDRSAEVCAVSDRLVDWRKIRLSQPAQALLTGLVIVADWIASNPDLFPYYPDAADVTNQDRITSAWNGLDLPEPWQASEPSGSPQAIFASRFQLPPGSHARPVGERAVEAGRERPRPHRPWPRCTRGARRQRRLRRA